MSKVKVFTVLLLALLVFNLFFADSTESTELSIYGQSSLEGHPDEREDNQDTLDSIKVE